MTLDLNNYRELCRTCLSQNINMKSIFSVEEVLDQQISIWDILMAFSQALQIGSKEDDLPERICSNCVEEARRAFLFIKLCEKSNATLRSCLKSAQPNIKASDWVSCEVVNLDQFCDGAGATSGQLQENLVLKSDHDLSLGLEDSSIDEPLLEPYCAIEGDHKVTLEKVLQKKVKATSSTTSKDATAAKSNVYTCEECNEQCLGLASYWKHRAKIHGTIFKCEDCSKEFKTRNLLVKHTNSAHKPSVEDSIRPKRKRNKTDIVKKRNLPRTCEICNKTFRFHSNLERHKLIHTGERPFLCNVCGKGFAQMSYLKIHSFIHTGEKPYKCETCDRSFAAPGTLMTHIRIHTGERPHVCKICGKDFPQSGYLSAHIRTHTGEKPVECPVCRRRFNQSGRLVIHMRIHSGEKPYSCQECGRSFAVKGTLKKHIRTHTGERPYICSICGQAFAQGGTLATHMKVHKLKQ